jgi:hypothetical protein
MPVAETLSSLETTAGASRPHADRKTSMSFRTRKNATLKLIRRAHLFTGLFMTPWVFLYAVSGFLFNHPSAFPDRELKPFGDREIAGTGLENFPTAATVAARVVETLNAESSSRSLRLVEPHSAEFSRELIATATEKAGSTRYRIQLSLDAGRGTVSPVRAVRGGIVDDGLGGVARLPELQRDRLAHAIPALCARLGLDPATASLKTVPDVNFNAESRGRAYHVSYNLRSGVVAVQDDAVESLTARGFLTQLHKKRTFPERVDSRWFWAVSVDAMSALMIFWGASGLLMWWQIRSTRRWGSMVVLASGATALALALALYRVLSLN